jgi:predicted DNA-binding ribbon-helix-helix protein
MEKSMMPHNNGHDASQSAGTPRPHRSTLVSRNVTIAGHRTSVRLEPEMWSGLQEICRRERMNMHEVATSIAARKQESTSLTAALRVFVMTYFRVAATEDGHTRAGHGYGAAAMPAANAAPLPRAAANVPFLNNQSRMESGVRRF